MVSPANGRGRDRQFWCADFSGVLDHQPSESTAIDDENIANIKNGPLPRDQQAHLIEQPALVKAKNVVNTTLFFEAPTDWVWHSPAR